MQPIAMKLDIQPQLNPMKKKINLTKKYDLTQRIKVFNVYANFDIDPGNINTKRQILD